MFLTYKDMIRPSSDPSQMQIKGSLLKMLLKVSQISEEELFARYFSSDKGKDKLDSRFLLGSDENELDGLSSIELITMFSRKDNVYGSSPNKVLVQFSFMDHIRDPNSICI